MKKSVILTISISKSNNNSAMHFYSFAYYLLGGTTHVLRIVLVLVLTLGLHLMSPAQTSKASQDSVRRIIAKPKVASYGWNEESIFKAYGLVKQKKLTKTGVEIINLAHTPVSIKATIEALMNSGNYEWVEEDVIMEMDAFSTTDLYFSRLWHLQHMDSHFGVPLGGDVHAVEAWNQSKGSSDIVVAVLDTGVDYTHPDLRANMWRNPGEIASNGIDDDHNGYVDDIHGIDAGYQDSDPFDTVGHGTHVAGIIGAKGNNKTGVCGVLWNTSIMALKASKWSVPDKRELFFSSDVVECLEYIQRMKSNAGINIRLVNCSFGGNFQSLAIRDAIRELSRLDILVVCAAGNGGSDRIGDDNDTRPYYPSCFESTTVVSVANTTKTATLASSSNFGRWTVDVAAPGTEIYSTIPGGKYGYMSGTSMAAPQVSGAAALLWSLDPGLKGAEVKKALIDGSDALKSLKYKVAANGKLNIAQSMELSKRPFLTAPAMHSTLDYDEYWFGWSANGRDVDAWVLRVGSQPGGRDLHDSGILDANVGAVLVRNLPDNGMEFYTTLYWEMDGVWYSRSYDSMYTRNLDPRLWSPAEGTVFEGSTVVFSWIDNDHSVEAWTLYLGNDTFGADIFASQRMDGNTSAMWIDDVPTDGRTIWVTLGWAINGVWSYHSYEFTAAFIAD